MLHFLYLYFIYAKGGSKKKWVFLTISQGKSGNSQGILNHALGMNPVIRSLKIYTLINFVRCQKSRTELA